MNTDPRLANLSLEEKRGLVAQMLQEKKERETAQPLSMPPALADDEHRRLLGEWNDTRVDFPRVGSLREWFQEQVERTPDSVAVVLEDQTLTYRELNERANRLANYLRSLGVGPEVMVGIHLDRSLEMVVGVFGVLKAGGAYVPLDPYLPHERLAFMVQDTQMPVILTRESMRNGIPSTTARALSLDSEWHLIAPYSHENCQSPAAPQNLAYVIYTSGSTGAPKGVLVEQRQVINYVQSILDRLSLPGGMHFAMVQPLAVDSCITVLFAALVSGGCLHLISEERAADAYAFADYFERHPIDLLKIAPSHLAALQNIPHPEKGLPRRWLVIGGEASRRDWVETLANRAPALSIFNHYGPTETTVGVTTYRPVSPSTLTHPGVPIGQPLANIKAYILDSDLKPVPIGVPGELLLGGACVARGYLNRPELTAEKFIPDPFSEQGDARLYKTGDLARYLPDGNIEFLGRMDQQIKIRGFRIEPGEIEAVLSQHSFVSEVVVTPYENEPGDVRLAAYIVPQAGHLPTGSEMVLFLKDKLPAYMIPTVFVFLDALPRTRHGKLDLRALPPPVRVHADAGRPFIPAETATEQDLLKIWAQVLKIDTLGIHDDFFELGGHSLLLTQVMSRLREQLGIELPLRDLFEAPTIALLAARIELERQIQNQEVSGQSPGLDMANRKPPLVPTPRNQDL